MRLEKLTYHRHDAGYWYWIKTSSENKLKKLEMFQKREMSQTFTENHQRNDPKKTTIAPDEIHFQIENWNILWTSSKFQTSMILRYFKGCSSHSFSAAHGCSELTSHSEGHTDKVPCYDRRSDITALDPQKPMVQFTTEVWEPSTP